jgi:hypothetical protein
VFDPPYRGGLVVMREVGEQEDIMSFIVSGLPVAPFQHLFGLSEEALRAHGAIRYTSDAPVGYPCRITLEDTPVGETVLLLNYEHQSADTPYRARHAIYVREAAVETRTVVDEVPAPLAVRPYISLRAFDAEGMMLDADLAPGSELKAPIERLLALPGVAYLHAHYAGRGCYAAHIERP